MVIGKNLNLFWLCTTVCLAIHEIYIHGSYIIFSFLLTFVKSEIYFWQGLIRQREWCAENRQPRNEGSKGSNFTDFGGQKD